MGVYLGIDIGTTGLKSVLVKADGNVLGIGYREYSISIPIQGYAEQNPEEWWTALKQSLYEAMVTSGTRADEILGIGLSGQMHGTILLDKNLSVLYPAIIWCDRRSVAQAELIRSKIGMSNLAKWTQNPIAVGFQACSLMWVKENMPEVYEKTRHVLLPKDYIRLRLTGQLGTEPTDACSTLLFDCKKHTWSSEMLNALQIDANLFPNSDHLPTEIHGGLTSTAASELGLTAGIPVVFGGGDQPMQAVGNGIIAPGDASLTLGTGAQILIPTYTCECPKELTVHTFCHAPQNVWYTMGAVLNGCISQNWFFDKILLTHDYNKMHELASCIPAGSNGLVFLPYLTGERTPYMNANARGMFFGLTIKHNRADMTRAVLEGVAFALKDAMNACRKSEAQISRLLMSGGGAKSKLWRQVIADMLERPVYTTSMSEQAGTGAAICAMVGTKAYSSLKEACDAIVRVENYVTMPDSKNSSIYAERFPIYRALYQANKELFQENSRFVTDEALS